MDFYNPPLAQANGEVERANRTILKALKIAKAEGKDLRKALVEFSMAYKATPHTATGMTPFALMFGREMRTKLPMLAGDPPSAVDEARDRDAQYEVKMKEYADRNSKEQSIDQSDTVVMRREVKGKLDTNYSPEPYQVIDVQGSDMVCSSPNGRAIRRHMSVAKKIDSNTHQTPIELVPETTTPRVSSPERKLPSKFKEFVMS
ncbi:uncharacterized protein [Watersipora subatra]|uniref:uncharacterized protein n=1 Tax=Watersipora subatra TaxID=2589382 RepID=UPI00355C9C60